MEGGVSIFLFLLILGGAGIGGFLLFGTGGYLRKKEIKDDLGDGDHGERPGHLRVEDDSEATHAGRSRTGTGEAGPPPPE